MMKSFVIKWDSLERAFWNPRTAPTRRSNILGKPISRRQHLSGIHQNTAIRLVDETKSRLAEAKRIKEDTAQTIEKSKVSIRHYENLVKRSQQVLTIRKL